MSLEYNKILQRQIKKYVNNDASLKEFSSLLKSISNSYDHFERDQKLVDRVMTLDSNELLNKNQDLKKLNEEMDRFVYSTSHDLRAPLLSIIGLLNIIDKENNQAELAEYFNLLRTSVEKLDRFISDIIDYSRNARLELDITKINLESIIDDSFKHLNYLSGCSSLVRRIEVDTSHDFYGDEKRLSIILNNLVSNAIKYQNQSISNSFIHIKTIMTVDTVELIISDNGIGIDEAYLQKIFDMFYRATHDAKGSGLGLYIVKETMDKMDGSIEVTSQLGEGSVFTLVIPNHQSI